MRKLLIAFVILALCGLAQALQKPMLGAQVNWAHPLSKSLVGCWLLNEGSGNRVNDLSGNGNIGTFQGTAPSWTPGKHGSAVHFPGTNEYIDIDNNFIKSSDNISISFWGKVDVDDGNFDAIMNLHDGTSPILVVYYNEDYSGFVYDFHSEDDKRMPSAAITITRWRHYVITWNGTSSALYLDGVKTAISVSGGNLTSSDVSGKFNIGRGYSSLYGANTVDNVLVYNCVLTASEIALLYRDPFCMFRREPIELWEAAAVVPAGGQVIFINLSSLGYGFGGFGLIFIWAVIKQRLWKVR